MAKTEKMEYIGSRNYNFVRSIGKYTPAQFLIKCPNFLPRFKTCLKTELIPIRAKSTDRDKLTVKQ